MNLKNGNITLNELLNNDESKKILFEEFPRYKNHPMIYALGNVTLKQGLNMIGKNLPKQKIDNVLERLKKI